MSTCLGVRVRGRGYGAVDGHDIYIGDVQVAWRPYDGSWDDDVVLEVILLFGELLREKTGWSERAPEDNG